MPKILNLTPEEKAKREEEKRKKNAEYSRAYRKRVQADAEKREKRNEYFRTYRQKQDPEKRREQRKAWDLQHMRNVIARADAEEAARKAAEEVQKGD